MKFQSIFSALLVLATTSLSFADDMPTLNLKVSVGQLGRKLINTTYYPQSSTLSLKLVTEAENIAEIPTTSEFSLKGSTQLDIVKPVLPEGCKASFYAAEIKPTERTKIGIDLEGASCQSLLDTIETTDFMLIFTDVISGDHAFSSNRLLLSIKNETDVSSNPR